MSDLDAHIYGSDDIEDLALVGEFDAQVWAKRFVATNRRIPKIATDEATMVAWFATAIMAGYDRGKGES